MNFIPAVTDITDNITLHEHLLEELRESFDDALYSANLLFDNAMAMNETNARTIKLQSARIAQEHVNSIDLRIEEYEDNLYDLRQQEFTKVEIHVYNLINSKKNIYNEIKIYTCKSKIILMKVADDGFQKADLIKALYQQSINNDYIDSLNKQIESIDYTAKIYASYLNHLSSLMTAYEEQYM